jgi:hypothetical protein
MKRKLSFIIAVVLAAFIVVHTSALAHGHTQVGDYELEIGFHNEPAIQGQPNSLDLFVTNSKTGEKVNNLQDTLKAEIIYGASKKELKLEPQEDADGAYTAYLIPTQVGDYTWHIFGNIENTPVDVSMTSSPSTFVSVEPASSYNFPSTDASDSGARTPLFVGIAGVALGFVGILIGLAAFTTARSRRG